MAQYEGIITLQNVNDGAAGRGVSSIETKYYLGTSSTQHPSDESSDWQDSLPALEQGKYLWTQTKVSYTSGDPVYNYSISYVATDGTITTQYYTRIKYAEDNQGTNWSDTPTSTTTYVGFYSGVEQSPAASQYTWSRYVGENGENGRGIRSTVVEYNSSSNNTSAPTSGWQSTIPSVAENSYLWTRTTITYTDNTTSISYTVAKQGAKGETGNAGKGISSTVIRYAVSNSGTVAPTGTNDWKANLSDITVNPGQFLWTRTVITYTDTTTSTSYSVAQYGETGAAGTSVSISSTVIQYGTSINTTTEPTDWSTTQKDVSQYKGKYLWTKTIVNYSPSGSTTTYSKTYIGEDGTDGINGQSSYTYIRYSEYSDGTDFVSAPTASTKYIGVYSGTSATAPTNKTAYIWSKYVGENGTNGKDGKDGNGITSITYYYKATTENNAPAASQITSTTMPTLTSTDKFLWQKEVIDFTDSTVADKVTVTLLAVYGDTGQAGTSITITNREITYADSTSGTTAPSSGWQSTIPSIANGHYLWTRTVVTYSDGSNTTAYSVAYKGTNGTNGDDGRDVVVDTNNSFVKYIVSTNGTQHPDSTANWTTTFPTSIPAGSFLWTWVHTAYKYSDGTSTNTSTDSYSVARQGENGEDGNKYYIKSNIDTIKRLFDVTNERVEFLPSQFEFQMFDNDDSSTPLQTSLYNYTATLILLDSLESYNITTACTVAPENNPDKVVLSIENLKQKLIELEYNVSLDVDDCQIRLEFSYPKVNGKIVAQQLVIIENGLEADFAKFKVNAANISANIANAGLVFSSEGLSINNGNFTINDENGNPLFMYDETEHKLTVTGNSYFSGRLDAAEGVFSGTLSGVDGDFTGKITANEGLIGGFSISQGQLISTDINQSIQLNGTDGSIVANNIKLGIGAEIDNYLKLGNAFIYNPEHEDRNESRLFISAGDSNNDQGYLKIYDTGNIDLGNIKLQGQDSIINLNSNDAKITAGNNVIITPDRSVFNNVDITGTLHTSVFEVGKVQTAGGAMIFKEGAEIDTIVPNGNNYNFTTKTAVSLKENSIVVFTNKDNQTIYGQITAVSDNIYTTTTNITGFTNIIQLADYENNNYTNNLVIGINSGSNNEKMLYPQALTMRTVIGYNNNEPIYTDKPTLVLGNLTNIIPSNSNIKGFGLYGQNVFLTGSLVTEFTSGQNISYAGVNTFNGVTANVFDNVTGVTQDNSKIVFWGGALPSEYGNDLDEAIKHAPFQVTENGSFYAGQGYFKGAIITDAEIRAASIYTADIYGIGTSEDALKIHDTIGGIGFYNGNTRLLDITNTGFSLGNETDKFIDINNNVVNFAGNTFTGEIFRGTFEGNLTTQRDNNNKYIGFDGPTVQGRQGTNDNYTILSYLTLDTKTILTNNNETIELSSGTINIDANITSMSKDVYFGGKMKYQQVNSGNNILGYDLYIS